MKQSGLIRLPHICGGTRALAVALGAALAAGLLSACAPGADGSGTSSAGTGGTASPVAAAGTLRGVLHGGQSPIASASVTLYLAGTSAGAAASVLGNTTTDSQGNFSFSNVTGTGGLCGSGGLLYVVASGGQVGGASNPANPAINLMAAIGSCSTMPGYAFVNELTTVAAAYALNGFISVGSGGTSGGSGTGTVSGCVDCTPSGPASNVNVAGSSPGLSNAFNTAALLADVTTGNPPSATGSPLPPASQCTTVGSGPINCAALETLTGLADALAACVNSLGGSTSSQCQELFECVVPNATYNAGPPQSCTPPDDSTLPGDTLAATLLVARNPGLVSTQGLVSIPGEQVVFAPGLTTAPNDWTIALSTSMSSPWGLAVDAQGDVWVSQLTSSTVTEFGPTGATLATFTAATYAQNLAIDGSGNVWISAINDGGVWEIPGGTGQPTQIATGSFNGIAADPSGNIWVADAGDDNGTLMEVSSSGGALSYYTGGDVGIAGEPPYGVAIDPHNNVWVTVSYYEGGVTEFSTAPSVTATSTFLNGTESGPGGVAIDPSGDVWVADLDSSAVTKLGPDGTLLWSSTSYGDGMQYPYDIAIDGAGTGWIANDDSGVSVLASNGTALTPSMTSTALTGGELHSGNQIAIDPSGNVWATDSDGGLVTEFIGAAAPTVTPLVAQITPSQ